MNAKTTAVIAAVGALLVGAVAGFALGRGTGGMHDGGQGGHMMGVMGDGPPWEGPMMDMGAMPGMSRYADGRMAMSDQAFLAMMIPHHRMAVDMAAIVKKRGRDPQVRRLAGAVITAQEREIAQMTRWYREWFGSDPPRIEMTGAVGMMGMSMDMDELRTTAEPDRVFLRMMIPHHAGAIMMAEMLLAGASDTEAGVPHNAEAVAMADAMPGTLRPEVVELAKQIVADQSLEIGEMQRMRARIAPPTG